MKSLLGQGANPSVHFERRRTALHEAAITGHLKIMSLLCEHTSDILCPDASALTPLHLCVLHRHNSLLRHLLPLIKGDIDLIDSDGNTALHYAAKSGDIGAIRLLLSHGASILISNSEGHMPAELCGNEQGYGLLHGSPSPRVKTDLPIPSISESEPVLYQVNDDFPVSLDRFAPLGLINTGEFGDVFLVQCHLTGHMYAMKSIARGKESARSDRKVLARLDHPFLVKLHWSFQTSSNLYLVEDYCPAGDLAELIRREGRLTEDAARFFAAEIVLAIDALHRENVVYRDLKPENIVLDTSGHLRLTDFSLSKEISTSSHSFCGPKGYYPPEMIREQQHTQAVDWYMLGCLLYEMIVGKPPFETQEETRMFREIQRGKIEFPADVSGEAKDVIRKLLRTEVQNRLGNTGAREVTSHPFFSGVSWTDVYAKRYSAPVATPRKKPLSLHGYAFHYKGNREASPAEGWSFYQ